MGKYFEYYENLELKVMKSLKTLRAKQRQGDQVTHITEKNLVELMNVCMSWTLYANRDREIGMKMFRK